MEDIQSWWEIPTIAHYCSLFREAFDLVEFDIEELEDALLASQIGSCPLITELITKLLAGCYGSTAIGPGNWEDYLKDLTKYQFEVQQSGPYYLENTSFHCLDLRQKVEILLSLCYARLEADDVLDLLKGYEGDQMRVEPVGNDREGKTYWYFYGSRLYKEDPDPTPLPQYDEPLEDDVADKKQKKNNKKKKIKKKSKKQKTKTRRSSRGRILKAVNYELESSDSSESEEDEDSWDEEDEKPLVNGKVCSKTDSTKEESDNIKKDNIKADNMKDENIKEDNIEEDDIEEVIGDSIEKEDENEGKNTEINNISSVGGERNTRWHIVCTTIDDWEKLCESFQDSDVKCEKDLHKVITENFLPDMPQIIEQKEKAMKKRLVLLQPKRISNRLQEKRDQYEEGLRLIDEEKKEEQKRRAEEEEERQHQLRLEMIKEQERMREERIRLREERARRAKLREERANLVAEGKEIPPELYDIPMGNKYYRMDSGAERDESEENLYKSFYTVLNEMKDHTDSWPFLQPVQKEHFPDYYDVIQKPMDLAQIECKCREGKYKGRDDFCDDFKLMFNNCILYNGENSDCALLANTLERFLHRLTKKHLPIEEKDDHDDDDEFRMRIPSVKRKHYRPRRDATARALKLFQEEDDSFSDEDDYVRDKIPPRKSMSPTQLSSSSKIVRVDQQCIQSSENTLSASDILKRNQELQDLIARKTNASKPNAFFKSKEPSKRGGKKMGSRYLGHGPMVPDGILFKLVDKIEREGFYPNGSPQQLKSKPGQMSGGTVKIRPTSFSTDQSSVQATEILPINRSSAIGNNVPSTQMSHCSSPCKVTDSIKTCSSISELNESKVQRITVGNKVVQGRVIQLPPGTKLIPGQPIQLMQDGKKLIFHTVNKSNNPVAKTPTTGPVTSLATTTGDLNSVTTPNVSPGILRTTTHLASSAEVMKCSVSSNISSPCINSTLSSGLTTNAVKTTTHITTPISSTLRMDQSVNKAVELSSRPDLKVAASELTPQPNKLEFKSYLKRKDPLSDDKMFIPKSILIGSKKHKSSHLPSKKIVTFNEKVTAVKFERQDEKLSPGKTFIKTSLSCGGTLLSEKMPDKDSSTSPTFPDAQLRLLPCFQSIIAGNLGSKAVKNIDHPKNDETVTRFSQNSVFPQKHVSTPTEDQRLVESHSEESDKSANGSDPLMNNDQEVNSVIASESLSNDFTALNEKSNISQTVSSQITQQILPHEQLDSSVQRNQSVVNTQDTLQIAPETSVPLLNELPLSAMQENVSDIICKTESKLISIEPVKSAIFEEDVKTLSATSSVLGRPGLQITSQDTNMAKESYSVTSVSSLTTAVISSVVSTMSSQFSSIDENVMPVLAPSLSCSRSNFHIPNTLSDNQNGLNEMPCLSPECDETSFSIVPSSVQSRTEIPQLINEAGIQNVADISSLSPIDKTTRNDVFNKNNLPDATAPTSLTKTTSSAEPHTILDHFAATSSLNIEIPSFVDNHEARSPKFSPSKTLQQQDSILDKLMNEISFTQLKNKSPSPPKSSELKTSPTKSPLKAFSTLNTSGLSKILSQQLHPLKKRKQGDYNSEGISPIKTPKNCDGSQSANSYKRSDSCCDISENSSLCVNGAVHGVPNRNLFDNHESPDLQVKQDPSCISLPSHQILSQGSPPYIFNSDRTIDHESHSTTDYSNIPQTSRFSSPGDDRPPIPKLKISVSKHSDGNRKVQFSSSILHVVKGQSGATVIERSPTSGQELDSFTQDGLTESSDRSVDIT